MATAASLRTTRRQTVSQRALDVDPVNVSVHCVSSMSERARDLGRWNDERRGNSRRTPSPAPAPPPPSSSQQQQQGYWDSGGMPLRRSTRTQHTTLDLTRSSSPDSPSTANSNANANANAKGNGKRRSAASPDVEVVVDVPAPTKRARGAAKGKAKAHVNAATGSGSVDADEALARRLQDEEDHDYYNAAAVSLVALRDCPRPELAVSSARALVFLRLLPARRWVRIALNGAFCISRRVRGCWAATRRAWQGETRGLGRCLRVRLIRTHGRCPLARRLIEIGGDAGCTGSSLCRARGMWWRAFSLSCALSMAQQTPLGSYTDTHVTSHAHLQGGQGHGVVREAADGKTLRLAFFPASHFFRGEVCAGPDQQRLLLRVPPLVKSRLLHGLLLAESADLVSGERKGRHSTPPVWAHSLAPGVVSGIDD